MYLGLSITTNVENLSLTLASTSVFITFVGGFIAFLVKKPSLESLDYVQGLELA